MKPAFWGTQLINLPTTKTVGAKNLLFRVSHRFFRPISNGYNEYYGLNGPAFILISLGYGFRENLSLTMGHSNYNHEWEVGFNWLALKQGQIPMLPISVAVIGGGSLITVPEPCHSVWRSENLKMNLQLSISHQFSDELSLMLVPSFSSNTNTFDPLSENTFVLGTGSRFMFADNFSVIGEWLPVISGYKDELNSWGLGLEYKIGGHVFQVFLTNTYGLTTDQYIIGGDLKLENNHYRVGFNIFRSFWF
ncbi:MAG: hypothetical protein JSW07_20560 [bacterium]|nr:MAG: hypothetical protein JSW07_20560 [bacterium]